MAGRFSRTAMTSTTIAASPMLAGREQDHARCAG